MALLGWAVFGVMLVDQLGDGPLQALDPVVSSLVPHEGALYTASNLATHLGDQVVLVAFTLLGTAILLRAHRYVDAALLAIAKAVSAVTVAGVKYLVGRGRPLAGAAEGGCCSFPSGHATGTAMVFILLAILLFEVQDSIRPWAEGVAIGTMLVVGSSRIVLNVHWASDVIAGWGLGFALAGTLLMLRAYLQRNEMLPNLARRERVSNGVDLGLANGVNVYDEAGVLGDLEDVAEDGPVTRGTDPLHAEKE